MGFMDKLKGLLKGRETQVKQGIDKVSDTVESKVPEQHRDKVEGAAEKAKDVVDDLAGNPDVPATPPPATPPTAATPPPTTTTSPATPPTPATPPAGEPPTTATPPAGAPPTTEP